MKTCPDMRYLFRNVADTCIEAGGIRGRRTKGAVDCLIYHNKIYHTEHIEGHLKTQAALTTPAWMS